MFGQISPQNQHTNLTYLLGQYNYMSLLKTCHVTCWVCKSINKDYQNSYHLVNKQEMIFHSLSQSENTGPYSQLQLHSEDTWTSYLALWKRVVFEKLHLKSQAVLTTKSLTWTWAGVPPCFTESNKKVVLNDAACFLFQYSQSAKEPYSCS